MNAKQKASADRIRKAVQLIETLAPLELKRFSQKRKHDMESAYATLALHATKLYLQPPKLSTMYDPQQYLEHARNIGGQLTRLEALTLSEPTALEGQGTGWRVQPEESPELDYEAFERLYCFTRPEIDGLVQLLQAYYPGTPIQNRTVEWAVLKQRDLEGQNALASAE